MSAYYYRYRGRPYQRNRPRYRRRGSQAGPAAVVAIGALLASGGWKAAGALGASAGAKAGAAQAKEASAARVAVVAFARARVGKVPYAWGGTTDAGMDCAGLAQAAWASAGVTIERTSQQQWASEPHVTSPAPGDLVFFAGSDGTTTAPGHVGIVTGKNTMIDAYATGTDVRYDTFGAAAAPGTGLSAVVGFTDPASAAPPAQVVSTVAGTGETAFYTAVLADLGAPATQANLTSMEAWGGHEGCWGCVAKFNQLDSILYMPGATAFNTFAGNLHVWDYPDAATGAKATALTIEGFRGITRALLNGNGLRVAGLTGEFSRWSGGGYTGV